jgi:hypothetical protein
VRSTPNSRSRACLTSTTVSESMPSSDNVEFGLMVFRLRIPARKITFIASEGLSSLMKLLI